MTIDKDTLGNVAIRLGRAFEQAWAADIPRKTPFDWRACYEAVITARASRKPHMDFEHGWFHHEPRGMRWNLTERAVSVVLRDKHDNDGEVRAVVNELGQPVMLVTIRCWEALTEAQVRRYDALTAAVACGPWEAFYRYPPPSVLGAALGSKGVLPCYPVTLVYAVVGDKPGLTMARVNEGECEKEFVVTLNTLASLVADGLLDKWHRMRIR
jgi:hypothetical protein